MLRFWIVLSLWGGLCACAPHPLTPTPLPTETLPPPLVRASRPTVTHMPLPTVISAPEVTHTPLPTVTNAPEVVATLAPQPVVDFPPPAPMVSVADTPVVPPPAANDVEAISAFPTELPLAVPVAPPLEVAPPPSADVAAAEAYTIDLINQQRALAGLGPLLRDEALMGIARSRVADMVARGYTGHYDPVTGASLGANLTYAAGFSRASENWYGSIQGPPRIAEIAMGWFMTDPPHYRSILSPDFTVVGVGIAYNGRLWLLVQNFATP